MPMQPIVFKVALFRGDWDQARSQHGLLWLLESLVRINQAHIRQFRSLAKAGKVPAPYPPLYFSGVHYEPEPGTEEWLDIPTILDVKSGVFPGSWCDCEDLSGWRTAELRELPWHFARPGSKESADPRYPQPGVNYKAWKKVKGGIKAKPFAKWRRRPDGSYAYHALVLLPDGRLEDPSLVLGMRKEPEFAKAGTAEKLKARVIKPVIQYSAIPDVVVVDPERPSGFAKSPAGARKRTGLLLSASDLARLSTVNGEG